MKKLVYVSLLCVPLVFFGCASKEAPVEDVTEEVSLIPDTINDVEESDEIVYQSENQDSPEEQLETTSLDQEEESSEDNDSTETDETYIILEEENELESDFPIPEEIEEPEVREAPIPDEIIEIEESDEITETPEPLEVEELVDVELVGVEENTYEAEETVIEDNYTYSDEVLDVVDEEESENTEEEIISEDTTDESEEEEVEDVIVPSRSVTIKNGEYLDIEYPGKGWVYLGAVDMSKNLTYFGRKLGTENTKYSFSGKTAGTVILHFYKEDLLTDTYIDDYIEITILPQKTTSKDHVLAPSYSEIVPKPVKELKTTEEQEKKSEIEISPTTNDKKETSVQTKTETKNTDTFTEPVKNVKSEKTETSENKENEVVLTPEEYLQKAQNSLASKKYEEALEYVNAFILTGGQNMDEALYLQGQIYEASSSVKDIKKSVEAYEKLTSMYPASKYWDAANKRVIYLKRFYINVR